MISKTFLKLSFFSVFISFMASCSTDEDDSGEPTDETYETQVLLTDAPIDNPDVQAVFITVAQVKVNGIAVEGFEKATIEVSDLTEGSTELLGSLELEAGETSSVSLVLDHAADASGNTPGSYIVTTGGEKLALATGTTEINLGDQAEIYPVEDNALVIDFDLRKAITADAEGNYAFVGEAALENHIRVVNALNTGTIDGSISNLDAEGDSKVVVFAYEEGTFEASEMDEDSNGIQFGNAVSSDLVSNSSGEFSLNFLEEGTYELYFMNMEDTDGDGALEVSGELDLETSTGVDLEAIEVAADSRTTLELSLAGLLGL